MKKLILAVAALLVVALLVVPSFPQAQTDTQSLYVPHDVNVFVACANNGQGELVVGSGNVHAVFSSSVNGKRLRGSFQFNPNGLTAVGQTTGTIYHMVGLTRQDWTSDLVDFPWEATFVSRYFMISEGSEGNFKGKDFWHFTVNANGTMTVALEKSEYTCQ